MRSWDEYKKTMQVADTPCLAAKANDLGRLQWFAAQGADLNEKDERGYSPLMLAAYHGHEDAARYLIARGADVDSADSAGNTVLMGAAFKGYTSMAAMLLASGANRQARNLAGMTAEDVAKQFGRFDIAQLLNPQAQTVAPQSSAAGATAP